MSRIMVYLLVLGLGLAPTGALARSAVDLPEYLFPPGFLWGAATASYQVEGGIQNNWSEAGLDAGEAVDHYNRYREDFAQAQNLGLDMYRMSVEWARIEPREGAFDAGALAHYRKMIQNLQSRGIQPMVTLWHFTLPQWFEDKGGWKNPDNIRYFERYADRVASALGPDVYYWNTVNEPLVYAFKSHMEGAWPPFGKDINQALRVVKHLILAHGKAYAMIHKRDPISKVGFAKNITLLQPHWPYNPLDHMQTSLQSYLFNEAFWEATATGKISFNLPGLEPVVIPYSKDLEGSMDFIGINYYTRYMVTAAGGQETLPNVPVSELGWEIYPEGLLQVLRLGNKHAQRLRVPIIITENGTADHEDHIRQAFLVQHVYQIWKAIQEGIPVAGYLHWSLIDNFEWADGYEPKFGLMDKDRKWRDSAKLYRKMIHQNGLSEKQRQKYTLK